MLAMADRNGRVWASIPGLANRARVTLEECESALEKFLSPDKYSRTSEFEGRRIEQIDGGWRLLNHEKYRSIRDHESVKESKRRYINKRRADEKSNHVENVEHGRHNAEADTEAEELQNPKGLDLAAWETFIKYRREIRKPYKKASITSAKRKLAGFGNDQMAVVEQTIANGWTGLFELRGSNGKDTRSRAKRFSDKLDEIARQDIAKNGFTEKLD